MDNIVLSVVAGVAIMAVLIVVFFIWEGLKSAYYWTVAKIMGWSEEEKFERETRWLDRAVARQAKDVLDKSPSARRMGAAWATIGIMLLTLQNAPPWYWWVPALLLIYIGLVKVAGARFVWWE